MKKLYNSGEKKFKRNLNIIDRFITKSLSEYYKDSGIYINDYKYNNTKKIVKEIAKNEGTKFNGKDTVYITDKYEYEDESYDDRANIIGFKSCYAYKFSNCTFKHCTFYLMDVDVSFIFDKSKVEYCNIHYVGSMDTELSLNELMWRMNIGGSIRITLNYWNSEITHLSYLFGGLDDAVVSISSRNSTIRGSSILTRIIRFGDSDREKSTFSECKYIADKITMTQLNKALKFNDCDLMIRKLNEIAYSELNDVLEVFKKMIRMEKDDRRYDALKIIYDLLYNSDSDLQTWSGVLFGHLRLPKVIIKNCVKSIILFAIIYMIVGIENSGVIRYKFSLSGHPLILLKNLIESFVESLYFSCCTFTTVGYGDYNINSSVTMFKIIPTFQMILGYIYSGVLIGSFYHKMGSNRYLGSDD